MKKRYRKSLIILWAVALCLALCAWYVTYINKGYAEVCFIDVGQGDACFVRNSAGDAVLIDGGDEGAGKYVLSPFFRKQFVTELDAVFISHLHSDHTEGIIELIDEGFRIRKIYLSHTADEEEGYDAIADRAKIHKIEIIELYDNDKIEMGELTFTVIAAGCDEGLSKNKNDNSVIMRLDCGENSILFTGDATQYLEEQTLNEDIDTDFLKIGHHGSYTSSDFEFISRVSPELSVISVGIDNKYNHPSEQTLETLEELDVPIMRTDLNGTITIIMTPNDIKRIHGSRSDK